MKVQKFIMNYFRAKLRVLSLISKKRAGNEAFRIFCTPYYKILYKPAQIAHAEQLLCQFEGLSVSGYRWNKGGGKKALIVHGFRSASCNFEHFAKRLSEKGYEVYAFDAPAHGLSAGKILTALTYKNFIAALNKSFGTFDAYITHSFGGLAVSLNLSETPDNHHIKTVLIAPAANSRTLIELFFKEMKIKNSHVQEHFYANIKRLSGRDIDWFSVNRCAQYIKGPVLWIHDLEDTITPVEDAKVLQRTAQSNFHYIFTKNLGHRRIYRDEKVVAAVMNFL